MEQYKIRPKARIIHTIGKDLITTPIAAILELIKNSHDANATEITIDIKDENGYDSVTIKDNGDGMSLDDITNKWLVPATDNKKHTNVEGRKQLGSKGIGRYASAILGNKFTLKSVQNKKEVIVELDWDDFKKDMFLDEVNIGVQENSTDKQNGTTIDIKNSNSEDLFGQLVIQEDDIRDELSIFKTHSSDISIVFNNKLVEGLLEANKDIIDDLYHYRIVGQFDPNTQEVKAKITHKTYNNIISENDKIIKILLEEASVFNSIINFDIKFFDRDTDGKEDLGKYISNGKNIKPILDKICGISILRNGFPIRPYGSQDFDWLELNQKRIQNTKLIGNDLVTGFIDIEDESKSSLIEKSSREGLQTNMYYEGLKDIINEVIINLNTVRLNYKHKNANDQNNGNNPLSDVQNAIKDKTYNREKTEKKIQESFEKKGIEVSKEIIKEASDILDKNWLGLISNYYKESSDKMQVLSRYRELGQISELICHELSDPLNEIRIVYKALEIVKVELNEKKAHKYGDNLKITHERIYSLTELIDPLMSKRVKLKTINLKKEIEDTIKIFKNLDTFKGIDFNVKVNDLSIEYLNSDLRTIFYNLINNSSYWFNNNKIENPKIIIECKEDDGYIVLHYKDNGPGIPDENKESIFDLGFTTKTGGTGIGLAIIREVLKKINATIKCIPSDLGAYFIIEFTRLKNND